MLSALEPALDAVAGRCGSLGVEDLAQPAPLLDLFHATHDRLHSRLFQS
jgi:urease accessory protein